MILWVLYGFRRLEVINTYMKDIPVSEWDQEKQPIRLVQVELDTGYVETVDSAVVIEGMNISSEVSASSSLSHWDVNLQVLLSVLGQNHPHIILMTSHTTSFIGINPTFTIISIHLFCLNLWKLLQAFIPTLYTHLRMCVLIVGSNALWMNLLMVTFLTEIHIQTDPPSFTPRIPEVIEKETKVYYYQVEWKSHISFGVAIKQ